MMGPSLQLFFTQNKRSDELLITSQQQNHISLLYSLQMRGRKLQDALLHLDPFAAAQQLEKEDFHCAKSNRLCIWQHLRSHHGDVDAAPMCSLALFLSPGKHHQHAVWEILPFGPLLVCKQAPHTPPWESRRKPQTIIHIFVKDVL